MLFLNPLNPFNFRETVHPAFNVQLCTSTQLLMQQILNILQNELFYPLAVQFGVDSRFSLILYNI